MWIHSSIMLFASVMYLLCLYYSFDIAWVRPMVPVSHGLYTVNIPMEIGLLQCFSEICKDYEAVNRFLSQNKIPWFEKTSPQGMTQSSSSFRPSSISPDQTQLFPTPKQSDRDAESIKSFLFPYEAASFLVRLSYIPAAVGSTLLVLVFLYETSQQVYLFSNNFKNILLLVNTFSLFVGVVSYLFLTYFHLNGGIYLEGIWMMSYTTIIGLLSCLLVNILETSYEAERIHQSVEYYHRNTPQRKYYQYQGEEVNEESNPSSIAPIVPLPPSANIYQTPPRRRAEIR